MTRIALAVIVLSLAFGISCKRSVEDESKAYDAAVKQAKGLMALYPNFKAAIQSKLDEGKGLADSAKDMSDEEAAAKKMAAAHRAITSGLVTDLGEVDKLMKEVNSAAVSAAGKAKSDSDKAAARVAGDQAKAAIAKVDRALQTGAADVAGAEAVVKRALSDLKAASQNLKAAVAGSNQTAAKAAADKKAAADAKKKAEEKVADWKCQYCTSMNKHKHMKCQSCGASRPPPKAKK